MFSDQEIDILLKGDVAKLLRVFLEKVLPRLSKDWWEVLVLGSFYDDKRGRAEWRDGSKLGKLDIADLLYVLARNWRGIQAQLRIRPEYLTYVKELEVIRNERAHRTTLGINFDDDWRDLDTIERFVRFIGASSDTAKDLLERIAQDKKSLRLMMFPPARTAPPAAPAAPPAGGEEAAPPALAALARETAALYQSREIQALSCVSAVGQVMPILYFGDYAAYDASALRVVTAALNPSCREFQGDDPFHRFPGAAALFADCAVCSGKDCAACAKFDTGRYLAALNGYFKIDPYMTWFKHIEPLLAGLDCGLRPGSANTALNTNLCSPFATNPTWSGVKQAEKHELLPLGRKLWQALVKILQPDVLLISVTDAEYKDIIPFCAPRWEELLLEPRPPCRLQTQVIDIGGKRCRVVSSNTTVRGFWGGLSDNAKREAGQAIKALLPAG